MMQQLPGRLFRVRLQSDFALWKLLMLRRRKISRYEKDDFTLRY
jgi:hypothetical protein